MLNLRQAKPKTFNIGFNKTGTTSFKKAMEDWGYKMGNQPDAELLIRDWAKRDFDPIIKHCKSADAFQDIPFSLPFTYIALDQTFNGSKFVLTVREDADEWYDSMMKFHSKFYADGEREPTADDYKQSTYRYKGYSWESRQLVYDVTEDNPNDKQRLTDLYNRHIENVADYFRHRPDDLLILNVSEKESYGKLAAFLNKEPLYDEFPWENKTSDIDPQK